MTLSIIVDEDFEVTTISDDEAVFCSGTSLELFVEEPPGVTYDYLWNGPDLVDDTSPNPMVTTDGLYEVIVQNGAGCVDTQMVNVSISPLAMAAAGEAGFICQDSTFTLADAVAGTGDLVTWSTNGTGTFDNANIENPVYTPGLGESGFVFRTRTSF